MKIDMLRTLMITQIVFLENTFEGIAIKRLSGPGGSCFAKPKGEAEYPIKSSSVIVADAFMDGKELTETQYKNY